MNDATDKAVLNALQQHHGTIILNNPSKALLAVGKENTELHDELHRVYAELDLYRTALQKISELKRDDFINRGHAVDWAKKLATAALSQIAVGGKADG